eukprot:TRINITY_DN4044_c1_g1_i1.p1 TRINITY_DN4044_c1_g1~~TRINITY_DN4044_c1_g1_i1.p1  ORF type:complete len:294 (+),score=64.32 TRINITY_DN4044_c1_g1_i1:72-953(+)
MVRAASAFQELLCSRRSERSRWNHRTPLLNSDARLGGRGSTGSLPPVMEAVFPFLTAADLSALCATSPGLRLMMEEPSASSVLLEWARGKSWFSEFHRQFYNRRNSGEEAAQEEQEEEDQERPPHRTTASAVRDFVSMRGRRLEAEAHARRRRELLAKWLSPFVLTLVAVLFVTLLSKLANENGITEPPGAVIVLIGCVGALIASLIQVYSVAVESPLAACTSTATAALILSYIDKNFCCAWEPGSLKVYSSLHFVAAIFGTLGWLASDINQKEPPRHDIRARRTAWSMARDF